MRNTEKWTQRKSWRVTAEKIESRAKRKQHDLPHCSTLNNSHITTILGTLNIYLVKNMCYSYIKRIERGNGEEQSERVKSNFSVVGSQ